MIETFGTNLGNLWWYYSYAGCSLYHSKISSTSSELYVGSNSITSAMSSFRLKGPMGIEPSLENVSVDQHGQHGRGMKDQQPACLTAPSTLPIRLDIPHPIRHTRKGLKRWPTRIVLVHCTSLDQVISWLWSIVFDLKLVPVHFRTCF